MTTPELPPNPEELTPAQEIAGILEFVGEEFGFDPETVAEVSRNGI